MRSAYEFAAFATGDRYKLAYNLYSRKLIKLPSPHFVVFYNGTQPAPDHERLKLSSAFEGTADALKSEDEQPH